MKRLRASMIIVGLITIAGSTTTTFAGDRFAGSKRDQQSLTKTGEAIRAAFARGDIDAVMAYHHPDVIKALAPDKYLVGREAVRADLSGTFRNFRLDLVDDRVESTFFNSQTAGRGKPLYDTWHASSPGYAFSLQGPVDSCLRSRSPKPDRMGFHSRTHSARSLICQQSSEPILKT